jgi:hypothetical protein
MPLFLCRWPNGDCSVVWARNKDDAIVELDQIGNADGCPLAQIRTFQLHFALTDRGDLRVEGFGEGTREEIFSFAYPLLEKALHVARGDETGGGEDRLPPDRRAAIAQAVEHERRRIEPEGTAAPEPRTQIGRDVQKQTDLPTILVDRLVRQVATRRLRRFRSQTKPS